MHHLVSLSWIAARPDAAFTFAHDHFATEQHIRSTGIPFRFLRMALYIDFSHTMVGTDGTISGSARDSRVAAVLRDDVAESAVATLLGDGHLSETYNLTGPEAFTVTEAAEAMSRVSGKVIRFHSDDVRTLTGHAPVSLARYIETDPDSLAHVVSTTVPD